MVDALVAVGWCGCHDGPGSVGAVCQASTMARQCAMSPSTVVSTLQARCWVAVKPERTVDPSAKRTVTRSWSSSKPATAASSRILRDNDLHASPQQSPAGSEADDAAACDDRPGHGVHQPCSSGCSIAVTGPPREFLAGRLASTSCQVSTDRTATSPIHPLHVMRSCSAAGAATAFLTDPCRAAGQAERRSRQGTRRSRRGHPGTPQ